MKKLLALVLALVMTLGLATVSSSAAYSDEADVSLNEAVDVMSAVGVFQGSDGKFSPKENLTREQAAKLIAYLDLGESAAEALPGVKVFSDVEATRWSAKYIAYCQDAGYIAGVGDGKFNPTGELTGYAFGKMILCVLGYDAGIEGFTGNAWSINVAKLMEKNDIADGVSGAASATLTREQAAQYCLNALKATTVKYDTKGTSIEINGAKIATGASKAEDVTGKGNQKFVAISGEANYDPDTAYTVELGEKLYKGDLKLSTVANGDDFGRNAKAWTYKNGDDIATHAESADLTFVAGKTYNDNFGNNKVANAAKIIAQINDQLDYTKASSKLAFTGSTYNNDGTLATIGNAVAMYTNGVQKTLFEGLQIGDVVELYLNDSDNKKVDEIVVIRYSIAQIDSVSTSLTKAQKEDGATCKVKVGGHFYTNDNIDGFDAATFVEDAYILYVANSNYTKLIATAIPTAVEGKVTAIKGSQAQIGGTYYENPIRVSNGDEGTFYLGMANQIMAADTTAAKSTDYAYVYNWTYENKADSDGEKKDIFTVYYVKVDGTKASAVAKVVAGTDNNDANKRYLDNGGSAGQLLGSLNGTTFEKAAPGTPFAVAFSINSDGKFVQKAPKDGITAPAEYTIDKTHPTVGSYTVGSGNNQVTKSVVATNDTQFVLVYKNDSGDWKVKTATGYKNVKVATTNTNDYDETTAAVYNSDNEAVYAFVNVNNTYKSGTKLAVLLDAEASVTTNDDNSKTYATFAVAIDGEETTLTFEGTGSDSDCVKLAAAGDGSVFAYKMNGDYAELDTDEFKDNGENSPVAGIADVEKVQVVSKGNDYFNVSGGNNGTLYRSISDAKIYTITVEYESSENDADIESVTVSEGATIDANDFVVYTLKSGSNTNVETLFVYEVVR